MQEFGLIKFCTISSEFSTLFLTITKILSVVFELRWNFGRRRRLILNRKNIIKVLKFNTFYFWKLKNKSFSKVKGIQRIVLVGFTLLILGLQQGEQNLTLIKNIEKITIFCLVNVTGGGREPPCLIFSFPTITCPLRTPTSNHKISTF